MTLSTHVHILDETGPHELFRHCQTLLSKYDDRGGTWREQACYDKPDDYAFRYPEGTWSIANKIGQGLPAILDITYRPGAPLATEKDAATCTSECDPDNDYHYHPRACWLDIDLDTSYGYRDARGWGCGDLHAVLVAEVGQWCDERKLRWSWMNEFTSEIHGGPDRYERLFDLSRGGAEANAWLTTMVRPAIKAMAAAEGAEVQWS